MRNVVLLVIGLLAGVIGPVGGVRAQEDSVKRNVERAVSTLVEQLVPEQEQEWRFTFVPNGELWMWQFNKKDPQVHWDYGASIYMEIARGHGHRIWWGGTYREAAGFGAQQTVTPFDPRQIDVAQHFTWRYARRPRRSIFVHLSRWCYHEIDIDNASSIFFTHAAFGVGTISPPEEGEAPMRVRARKRPQVDAYFLGGPYISGNNAGIFGNASSLKGEFRLFTAYTFPVTRTFLLQVRWRWEALIADKTFSHNPSASPHAAKTSLTERFLDRNGPWYQRMDLRFSLIAQRDRGNASLFFGRHLMDFYPVRSSPADWYLGIAMSF